MLLVQLEALREELNKVSNAVKEAQKISQDKKLEASVQQR